MLLQSNNVWTLNQAAVTASWRIKSLPSAKCLYLCMPGREHGGQREPAVEDFPWVGEGDPGKQNFIGCLLSKAGYFQLG